MKMRASLALTLALAGSACASLAVPALRIDVGDADQDELRAVITVALGTRVVLSEAAFVDTYRLSFGPPMNAATADATGRMIERPSQFELKAQAGRCFLVHVNTGASYPLDRVRCRAIER